MVNTQLLDKRIDESGFRIGFIIDKLGLSRNGFDKKRKGKTPFRTAEIYVISDLLKLSDTDQKDIFFADEVAVNTNLKEER